MTASQPEQALGPAARPSGAPPMGLMTLPYVELVHALVRAHRNARVMTEVNRDLADTLRAVVRRQQDLALELADEAMSSARTGSSDPAAMFDRAADAVREIGNAFIDAQLSALRRLQAETAAEARPAPAASPPPETAPTTGRAR